ncbi:ETEC_3214 domain-containing protein [Streptomyces sviceus]|uniref:ETEC_3214 domain-containing protein n=1 Tax=Streptomyces sviceus TaxID=285530 RepID=UPI0036C305C2
MPDSAFRVHPALRHPECGPPVPRTRNSHSTTAASQAARTAVLGDPLPAQEESPPSIAERFSDRIRRDFTLVTLFFLASLVTAVSTFITAGLAIRDWQRSRQDWRPAEYRKLAQLRAGQTFERFKAVLGVPSFRGQSPLGVSHVFHPRKDYWVDVLVDKSHTVLAYSVTSCSDRFRPTFKFRNSNTWASVTLNEKSFDRVLRKADIRGYGFNLKVFGSAATSSDYAFVTYVGGNATSYRTYSWGINDTCAAWTPSQRESKLDGWKKWYFKHPAPDNREGNLTISGENIKSAEYSLLNSTILNTYAETAPLTDISTVYPRQIGVDRITVRP